MALKSCLFTLLALFFVACAGVRRDDMARAVDGYELPGRREPGKASVYIVRPSGVGALIRFNVFVGALDVDTLEAGYTRGGQHLHFNVGPEERTLYSVAENTAEVRMVFQPDSTYFIRQDAAMGLVMARNRLVVIDPVEGAYHVKNTKPGTSLRASFP